MAKTKKATPKSKTAMVGQFFVTPITIDDRYVTIKLPKKVASYLELESKEIHWAAINGVIQLSGNRPAIAIPMMGAAIGNFVPSES